MHMWAGTSFTLDRQSDCVRNPGRVTTIKAKLAAHFTADALNQSLRDRGEPCDAQCSAP